jgi:hypothetical protein
MEVGFVFKANDRLFISEYLGNNNFSDGYPISNNEPYEELGENQLAFVEIVKYPTEDGDIVFELKDHGFYTIDNDFREGVKGYEILLEVECRSKLCEIVEELTNNALQDIRRN